MATEAAELMTCGVYVNRVVRGHKRTFFNLSIPNDWIREGWEHLPAGEISCSDKIDLAHLLDLAFRRLLEEPPKAEEVPA